jgi:hypothetical protein
VEPREIWWEQQHAIEWPRLLETSEELIDEKRGICGRKFRRRVADRVHVVILKACSSHNGAFRSCCSNCSKNSRFGN